MALCSVAAFSTLCTNTIFMNLQIGVPYSKLVDTAKIKEVIPVRTRKGRMVCVL